MRVQGQPYLRDDARPATSWDEALRHLESARTFWLATVREDGSPHLMPLLAVCVEGEMYFCAGAGTRKSRNLARDPLAPTAGPPPLTLYRLEATRAYGFGTDQSLNAMRWTFE